MGNEPDQEKPGMWKRVRIFTWRALLLLFFATSTVFFVSHFPFDRVEYIYQGY